MKKLYLLLLTMFLVVGVTNAQKKKVGYFTSNKTMDASAAKVTQDPIIRMLQADTNLLVTVNATLGNDTVDLTGYDIIIVQESYNGGDAILQPGKTLALDTFMVPVVYNKAYAFKAGRALAAGSLGTGAETKGSATQNYVYLKVDAANQSNPLFKGITFVGDSVALFKTSANDVGVTVKPDNYKALNYAKSVVIKDTATGDTIKTTLLGKPSMIIAADTSAVTISFNDIPAGTKVGSETLKARMITLGMNFGAISGAYGSNMTEAGLTIWRNAVYIAAGLTIPDEPAEFQKWKIGYFTLAGKTMDPTAAIPTQDPIITMLQENNDQWDLVVNEVSATSKVDLGLDDYDAIIIQESFNGNDTVLKPMGSLGLANIPVPFIYNKNYAFRATRAFAAGELGTGAETVGILEIKVDSALQKLPLFNGITFEADSTVKLFRKGADDLGSPANTKALNYANLVVITDTASGDTLTNTLIALPKGISGPTVGFNDIPAGTKIGSEVLQARMITMGMNFGAICKDRGTNLTSAGLTMWRNAVLSALGLSIPTAAVPSLIPDVKIAIITPDTLGDEVQIKFLQQNGMMVDRMWLGNLGTISSGKIDTLNSYDLVIIGRAPNSGAAGINAATAGPVVNDSITAPIIANSPWHFGSGRLLWVNGARTNESVATGMKIGYSNKKDDPIFANSAFAGDSLVWSYFPDSYISMTVPINGDTIAYQRINATTIAPLVARFTVDSAFYAGSTDTVRAPRTYFGFGNDGLDDPSEAGGKIRNFFPLAMDAQAAYYGEIMHITGNPVIEPVYYISGDAALKTLKLTSPDSVFNVTLEDGVFDYKAYFPYKTDTLIIDAVKNSSVATLIGPKGLKPLVDGDSLTLDSTTFKVYVRAENNIVSTYTVKVYVSPAEEGQVGIEELTEAGISVFPNPANDVLTITGLKENTSISIINVTGQVVYSKEVKETNERIDLNALKNGMYIVHISLNGKVVTTKFVKQ